MLKVKTLVLKTKGVPTPAIDTIDTIDTIHEHRVASLKYQSDFFTAKIDKQAIINFVREPMMAAGNTKQGISPCFVFPALCYMIPGSWDETTNDDHDDRPELLEFKKAFFPRDHYTTKLCKLVFRLRYANAFLAAVECFQDKNKVNCQQLQEAAGVYGIQRWEKTEDHPDTDTEEHADYWHDHQNDTWYRAVTIPATYEDLADLQRSMHRDTDDSNYVFVAAAEMQQCADTGFVAAAEMQMCVNEFFV